MGEIEHGALVRQQAREKILPLPMARDLPDHASRGTQVIQHFAIELLGEDHVGEPLLVLEVGRLGEYGPVDVGFVLLGKIERGFH